jgi:nicotinamide riboside kinase
LFDTDGITLKIWAQYKFPTLQQAWWTDIPEGTLYVLCAPTNEYFKDPLRHDQENRETLHRTYEQLLSELGLPVFLLEEPLFEDRWKELLGKLEQKGIRRPY